LIRSWAELKTDPLWRILSVMFGVPYLVALTSAKRAELYDEYRELMNDDVAPDFVR
jgi:hypothetical protein